MKEIVIAGACRTAQAKLGGALKNFTNQKLGEIVLRGLIQRSRIDPREIDEVIFGCVGQQSDAQNVSRVIALSSGLPQSTPAFTVNRNCGSGLQSIASAAHMIEAGDAEVVAAGGVEVMSSLPFVNRDMRFGKKLRDSVMVDSLWEGLRDPLSGLLMGETAELLADEFKISRKEQDAFAVESHHKAAKAVKEGKFLDETVPVPLAPGTKREKAGPAHAEDEGPNGALSLTDLEQCRPVYRENGTVTAANSCPISDGAAAVLVTTREKAVALGLEVLAAVKSFAFVGTEPERMGLGPAGAAEKAMRKTGLSLKDIGLIEINEAFAAQYLAVEMLLKLNREKVNVNGGAIALGHPVGASGTRIVVTLLHEMKKRQLPLGLAALCIGGGQGGAVILERV